MDHISKIARYFLGAVFLIFGLNGFFRLIPIPPMSDNAKQFMDILIMTGYLNVVKAIEVIAGIMLLSGRFVPLALLMLGPITINILLVHTILDPTGFLVGAVLVILFGLAAWPYRALFYPFLRP